MGYGPTQHILQRMEDNMMYPIKDQETMLVVAMDMNRQQDTGYRIEIQGLHVRPSEEEPGEEAEAGGCG
uniref:Uncharacterized protein n=2 Tax=Oryza TaxID=4527 RepID=A0A0D3FK50_9ORYZ